MFDDDDFKLALIHLLLPYAKKYYTQGLSVSQMQQNFEDLCTDSDKYMQLKLTQLRITNDDNDRLTKQDLADLFEQVYNIKISEQTAVSEFQRVGLTYNKGLRQSTRNSRTPGSGRSERGVFTGVQIYRSEPLDRNTRDPTTI